MSALRLKAAAAGALLLCSTSVVQSAPTYDPGSAEDLASRVYVGNDTDMPLSGDLRIAIRPTVTNSRPSTIGQALQTMRQALPRWYLKILKESEGNDECGVAVNNEGYEHFISSWIWVTWIKALGSPIRNELRRKGVTEFDENNIANAINIGLCQLVKTDDENFAVEYVIQMAK